MYKHNIQINNKINYMFNFYVCLYYMFIIYIFIYYYV